jgi:hypothetical protein
MTPDRIRSPDDFTPQPEDLEKLERIDKRCPGCGATWIGWTWKDKVPAGAPHRVTVDEDGAHLTMCYECLDRLEAEAQQRTQAQRAPPDLELERPETTEEDDHGW